ncbi:hypothetical protein RBB50_001599 [Rhinocladiella similis]
MTTHLPSPPSSRPMSPIPVGKDPSITTREEDGDGNEERALSERLDDLLASYLTLLDTYTTLRAQLSEEFSSGFYALAQANRNSTLGPGRRYGEEGYDERMKALKTVHIKQTGFESLATATQIEEQDGTPPKGSPAQFEDPSKREDKPSELPTPVSKDIQEAGNDDQANLKQSVAPSTSPSNSIHATSHPTPCCYIYSVKSDTTTTTKDGSSSTSSSSPSSPPPPSSSSPSNETAASDTQEKDKTKVKAKAISKDPLRWYGILVPPALRQCQTHFHGSLSSTIPELLGTVSALQQLEVNIWEVRRALGMAEDYEDGWDELQKRIIEPEPRDNNARAETDRTVSASVLASGSGQGKSTTHPASKSTSLLSPSSPPSRTEPRPRVLKLD